MTIFKIHPTIQKLMRHKIAVVLLNLFLIHSFTSTGTQVNGEKILVVSFFTSQSHKNVFEPLIMELANRGHKLTIISSVKSSKPHANIRDIVGMSMKELVDITGVNLFEVREKNEFFNPMAVGFIYNVTCRSYYEMPEVQQIQKEKFDLIIGNSFMNECTYGFIHEMNTTFILVHPQAPAPWTATITGAPTIPSFIPLPYFGFTHDMNFMDRFYNFLMQISLIFLNEYRLLPLVESIYGDYFSKNLPSVHEIERKTSLMLINSHFSLSYPRPMMPDMIEIGGMHCRAGQPLPKDLEDFISGTGDEGFIYFSMGSTLPAHKMQEKYRRAFVKAFSKLKLRVIWKWETGEMPDTPPNVMLSKWLPQQDILAHPKLRLFITQGGMLSTEEAIWHGVPLLGIPIFSDQDWNMKQSENNGFALTLEFRGITEEKILDGIHRILNNPKFAERAKYLSGVFIDRPQKPLDTAVYWTEYVIRHKGALHLRSPARDLNFFQYYSLDTISFAITILFVVFYTFYRLGKFLVNNLLGNPKKLQVNSSKKIR